MAVLTSFRKEKFQICHFLASVLVFANKIPYKRETGGNLEQ